MFREVLSLTTEGRGFLDLTPALQRAVTASGVRDGLAHLFLHHTSASLILCENADPTVRDDLARFFARLAPDGDRLFRHTAEGPDDMPAHVRTVLTQNSLTVPVTGGRAALGTWQGVYLWEHRTHPHRRRVTVTVWG
ncbi:MAG: YjbQ family protein [Myxococcales bacterium]|nr:YjbQ family protein [Myxococcales bacterium]